jgi:hypothetical protein
LASLKWNSIILNPYLGKLQDEHKVCGGRGETPILLKGDVVGEVSFSVAFTHVDVGIGRVPDMRFQHFRLDVVVYVLRILGVVGVLWLIKGKPSKT